MAKKKTRQKQVKKKRKWFNVSAPDIYNNAELDPILAAEPEKLINRSINTSLGAITGSPKDLHKKLTLKINDVKGETAHTTVARYFVMDNYLQRSLRKFPEQFFHVFNSTLKDGKKAKLKISLGGRNRMYRGQKTDILKNTEAVCERELSKQTSSGIFAPGYFRELEMKLKKTARQTYPIEHVKVWKVTIV